MVPIFSSNPNECIHPYVLRFRKRERERDVSSSLRGLTFFRGMETTNGNGREKDEGGKEEAAPLIKVNDVRSKLCAKHDGKIAINIARRKPR